MIVNVVSVPQLTETAPEGLIDPPAPAIAVIVYGIGEKDASIVWFACTSVNV